MPEHKACVVERHPGVDLGGRETARSLGSRPHMNEKGLQRGGVRPVKHSSSEGSGLQHGSKKKSTRPNHSRFH